MVLGNAALIDKKIKPMISVILPEITVNDFDDLNLLKKG
jgi:hypothetical protein